MYHRCGVVCEICIRVAHQGGRVLRSANHVCGYRFSESIHELYTKVRDTLKEIEKCISSYVPILPQYLEEEGL
jgi:hypothetical protein